jgi:hypothetical protein
MKTLIHTPSSPDAGVWRSKWDALLERRKIHTALIEKQRLFAQMVKDNITGAVKEQLSEEIGALNLQLHDHGK